MISKLLKLGATLKTEFAPYAKYDQTWQHSFSRQIEKGDKHPPVLVWLKKDNQKTRLKVYQSKESLTDTSVIWCLPQHICFEKYKVYQWLARAKIANYYQANEQLPDGLRYQVFEIVFEV